MLETGLSLAGLLLTSIGAYIAARNIIITRAQAESLSGTYVGYNIALYDALLAQSRGARNGLLCVVAGTVLQVLALVFPLFVPEQAHTQETASIAIGVVLRNISNTVKL